MANTPASIASPKTTAPPDLLAMPLHEAVRELKIHMLKSALTTARHNQKRAAAILGLTYHQFRGLYRALKDDLP